MIFQAPIANAMAIVWTFFEPLLFGLVGAEVNVEYMERSLVGEFRRLGLTWWRNSRCTSFYPERRGTSEDWKERRGC